MFMVLACAACSNDQPGQQGAGADTAQAIESPPQEQSQLSDAAVQAVSRDPAVYSRLPDPALQFDFEVRLKSDKRSRTASGKDRRGLALQYSGLSAAELWPRLDQTFSRAGYVAKGRLASESGTSKQIYSKLHAHTLTVSVPPLEESSGTSGVFWLGWDI